MTARSKAMRRYTVAPTFCALLAACGGADAPQATLLDADTLSVDAAARVAAEAHGAPGEAEPVLYVVRARRPADADRFARELEARGFEPLRVLP